MTDPDGSPPLLPLRSLARSLAAAGRRAGLLPADGTASRPAGDGPGAEAWRDAVEALGSEAVPAASGTPPRGSPKGDAALEQAFRDPLPPPDPTHRPGPHPVGPPSPALVQDTLDGVPQRVLVFPARTGRLGSHLLQGGVGEVRAHEPDPRLHGRLRGRAPGIPGLVPRKTPATELSCHREVDAVVADRPLQATRSLVGLLGRLHHALEDDGELVLVDVLRDEAEDPATTRNRWARAFRVHLRARGRDLVSRQDLWRVLIETGFRGVRFRPVQGGRYLVRARK